MNHKEIEKQSVFHNPIFVVDRPPTVEEVRLSEELRVGVYVLLTKDKFSHPQEVAIWKEMNLPPLTGINAYYVADSSFVGYFKDKITKDCFDKWEEKNTAFIKKERERLQEKQKELETIKLIRKSCNEDEDRDEDAGGEIAFIGIH